VPEHLDPVNAMYARLLSHLLLAHVSMSIELAGLADFLETSGAVSSEGLHSHLQVYREHHEQEVRDEVIRWLHEDPELTPDLDDLFGSSPQSPDAQPPPETT
jgi:hypothetical protein